MPLSVRLDKPWRLLTDEAAREAGGRMGVYELADSDGRVIRIGYAGGSSRFGLRGELQGLLHERPSPRLQVRYEITTSYLSRYRELLMLYVADHGVLPLENSEDIRTIGRISPG